MKPSAPISGAAFQDSRLLTGLSLSGGVVGLDDAQMGWRSDGVMMVGRDEARAGWRSGGMTLRRMTLGQDGDQTDDVQAGWRSGE